MRSRTPCLTPPLERLPRASRKLRTVLNTSETVQTPPMTRGSRRKRRRLRIALAVVAVLALVLVGSAAAYVAFLNHTVTSNVKHQALLPTPAAGESAPPKLAVAKDSQNFLVIGSDSRSVDASGSRSDVIVLVHINNDRSRVDLVHFPRDLYVSVPGHGKDKINGTDRQHRQGPESPERRSGPGLRPGATPAERG